MPPLKMLKRRISCLPATYEGSDARTVVTITLVFLSSKPALVRWFRLVSQPSASSKDAPYLSPDVTSMIPIRAQAHGTHSFQ